MTDRVKPRQSVSLDPDLWRRIEEYGEEHHLSRSAVLAEAARRLLEEREADALAKAEKIFGLIGLTGALGPGADLLDSVQAVILGRTEPKGES